ncbi:hypothetical protein HU200_055942 [Digitaria exilis]|uniref:Fe2OG dioxygenase domain-containing protein n=1 Tax=Digitaria exilis TaxID=1010633 RepID=A0A835AIY3_9POAL|nr:hypothetical protein HU200_055942 [Digitaria exilis]
MVVVLAKGELDQIALPSADLPPVADVPAVDLSAPAGSAREAAARALVAACEEDGFFRVTGHGVPMELVRAAEAAAAAFFELPQGEKEVEAPTLGYGSKQIGGNGDLGWVEYLLLGVTPAGAAVPASSSSTLPCAAAAASATAASSSSAPAGPLRFRAVVSACTHTDTSPLAQPETTWSNITRSTRTLLVVAAWCVTHSFWQPTSTPFDSHALAPPIDCCAARADVPPCRAARSIDTPWILIATLQELAPITHASLGLLDEYTVAMRRMACAVLELMAEGLGLTGGELARLVARADSDCMLRVNHYPPRPAAPAVGAPPNLTGFGEHTDPQIISVLRSNGTSGLEVARHDGAWAAVPADGDAFFVNVGDTLQVLTNGRFRSVRHRVVVNSERSRVSMIFFGGPPPDEKLAPLPELLVGDGGRSRYREFTWTEFKASGCRTRLEDDRLARFEN